MTWDDAFAISSTLALAGWVILAVAPRQPWVLAVPGLAIPLLLAAGYAVIMMQHFAAAGGGFGSVAEVRALFQSDPVLVAGWQHYLAYDLFLGTWVARRLDGAGVHRVLQWPVLGACFMLGPIGFLVGWALAQLAGHTAALRGGVPA